MSDQRQMATLTVRVRVRWWARPLLASATAALCCVVYLVNGSLALIQRRGCSAKAVR